MKEKNLVITADVLVSWLMDCVSCASDADCSLMLFDVVIKSESVNLMR